MQHLQISNMALMIPVFLCGCVTRCSGRIESVDTCGKCGEQQRLLQCAMNVLCSQIYLVPLLVKPSVHIVLPSMSETENRHYGTKSDALLSHFTGMRFS